MQYLSVFDWFISLSLISSRPILMLHMTKVHSLFLSVKKISLCEYVYNMYETYFIYNPYLFIHWWIFILLPHLTSCEYCYNDHRCAHYLLKISLSFCYDIHSGAGLLDHIGVLIFWGNSILFTVVVAVFYICNNDM